MFFDTREEFVSYMYNKRDYIIEEFLKRGFLFETDNKNSVDTFTVNGKTYKYIREYNVNFEWTRNLAENYMYGLSCAVEYGLALLENNKNTTLDDIHMETYIVERTIRYMVRDEYIKRLIDSYLIYCQYIRKCEKIRKEENLLNCKKYNSMKSKLISDTCVHHIAEYEVACNEFIQDFRSIANGDKDSLYYVESYPNSIEVELLKILCGDNKNVYDMSKSEILKYIKNLYTENYK